MTDITRTLPIEYEPREYQPYTSGISLAGTQGDTHLLPVLFRSQYTSSIPVMLPAKKQSWTCYQDKKDWYESFSK